MDIVISIYKNEDINKYISYFDAALLMLPYYSLNYENLDIDKAILELRKNNKKIILSLDKIMHPKDMLLIKEFLKKYFEYNDIFYYITDTGLLNYLLENNLNNRIIYNPMTMLCNNLDLRIYNDFNIYLSLSQEITLADTIKISEEVNPKLFMMAFGYRLMFYSKRKLVSLYKEKINGDFINKDLSLKEATRPDIMPIIENDNGTLIYRSYILNLFIYIKSIKNINFCYLDSLRIDENKFIIALKCFYDYINSKITIDEGIDILNNLGLEYKDGFIFKDSVYQKEELKND